MSRTFTVINNPSGVRDTDGLSVEVFRSHRIAVGIRPTSGEKIKPLCGTKENLEELHDMIAKFIEDNNMSYNPVWGE